jgi:hypothetical protein
MSSQEQIETTTRRSFLRNLPKTWQGKVIIALTFLALCFFAAWGIWVGRDLFALIIIAILVIYGIRSLTDALPFSSNSRVRWAENERLSELFPSYRYKFLLWLGIGVLLPKIWHYSQGQAILAEDLVVPFVFITCGLVATIVWHIRHSKNQRGG